MCPLILHANHGSGACCGGDDVPQRVHVLNNLVPFKGGYIGFRDLGFRVHVPNNLVLGFWVIVIIVQVLGKYMIIRYLDP